MKTNTTERFKELCEYYNYDLTLFINPKQFLTGECTEQDIKEFMSINTL